jgi:hypothetical protein
MNQSASIKSTNSDDIKYVSMYVSSRTVREFSFTNGRSMLLAYDDEEDLDFSFATEEGGEGAVMATAIATATSIAVAPPAADGIIEIPLTISDKK